MDAETEKLIADYVRFIDACGPGFHPDYSRVDLTSAVIEQSQSPVQFGLFDKTLNNVVIPALDNIEELSDRGFDVYEIALDVFKRRGWAPVGS